MPNFRSISDGLKVPALEGRVGGHSLRVWGLHRSAPDSKPAGEEVSLLWARSLRGSRSRSLRGGEGHEELRDRSLQGWRVRVAVAVRQWRCRCPVAVPGRCWRCRYRVGAGLGWGRALSLTCRRRRASPATPARRDRYLRRREGGAEGAWLPGLSANRTLRPRPIRGSLALLNAVPATAVPCRERRVLAGEEWPLAAPVGRALLRGLSLEQRGIGETVSISTPPWQQEKQDKRKRPRAAPREDEVGRQEGFLHGKGG